jgi:hypothetical protein
MKLWVHRNSLLIASFVNPNSEKSAEVRSEYPIYNYIIYHSKSESPLFYSVSAQLYLTRYFQLGVCLAPVRRSATGSNKRPYVRE